MRFQCVIQWTVMLRRSLGSPPILIPPKKHKGLLLAFRNPPKPQRTSPQVKSAYPVGKPRNSGHRSSSQSHSGSWQGRPRPDRAVFGGQVILSALSPVVSPILSNPVINSLQWLPQPSEGPFVASFPPGCFLWRGQAPMEHLQVRVRGSAPRGGH